MSTGFLSRVGLTSAFGFLAAVAGVHAQVAGVNFCNDCLPSPPDRRVLDVNGNPLAGAGYVAQLYVGTSPATLQAHTAAPSLFRTPGSLFPGTWVGGQRTITGATPGATLFMQ